MRLIDLTGKKFNRLIVVERTASRHPLTYWKCICECGTITNVYSRHLLTGATQSCGCLKRETTARIMTIHGNTKEYHPSRTYTAWQNAKNRCFNKKGKDYLNYGGRGITMCNRWNKSFKNFLEDMGECSSGLMLDRIDNDGDYKPGNCRWVNRKIQNRNSRKNYFIEYRGKTLCVSAWAEKMKMGPGTLYGRIKRNWSTKDALFTPVGHVSQMRVPQVR